MAVGDCVLTNYGVVAVSGATLKTVVDTINLGALELSGASLFLLPVSDGKQIQVVKVSVTGW